MRVTVINGYNASNLGDGLLVDAALDLVRESFPGAEIVLFAADPGSFRDREVEVRSPFGVTARPLIVLAALLVYLTGGRWGTSRSFANACADADLVVSVGGGYLRGPDFSQTLASLCVHLSQMRVAARVAKAWIALPQSVGPYHPVIWRLVRRVLSRAEVVCVRDDRSLDDLRTLPNVRRFPDCALLELPADLGFERRYDESVGLIVRTLPRPADYWSGLAQVVGSGLRIVPLLQSSVRGNDDAPAYARLGLEAPERTLLDQPLPTAVISVRLHGALMAIARGVPTVHLSYERKGFSAFADLGIPEFVVSARHFDPADVERAVREVLIDPSGYEQRIRATLPDLSARRADLLALLAGDRARTTGHPSAEGCPVAS